MNHYEYIVLDEHKQSIIGQIWAESTDEVKIKLKLDGYVICQIKQLQSKALKWSFPTIITMSQQLGLLLQSGIPLRRSLALLTDTNRHMPYQTLYESIQRGQNLSTALQDMEFPPIGLALLESGEEAGTLGESLQYIANYYDREHKWRQKIVSAIAYPLFLLLLMNVFFLVTILFIIPSFSRVFATMHMELPWMTRGLFALGQSLREHPFMYIGMHVGLVGFCIYGYRNTSIRLQVHKVLWQLARRNLFLTALYYTNIVKVWALLLNSGISIIHMMKLTKQVWRNDWGKIGTDQVIEKLQSGYSFRDSLESSAIGNSFIWQLVTVGEESGELVAMLEHCYAYYESLLNQYINRLERLMEPILLAIMGIGIGVLVVSVMYPLFTSLSSLSGQ